MENITSIQEKLEKKKLQDQQQLQNLEKSLLEFFETRLKDHIDSVVIKHTEDFLSQLKEQDKKLLRERVETHRTSYKTLEAAQSEHIKEMKKIFNQLASFKKGEMEKLEKEAQTLKKQMKSYQNMDAMLTKRMIYALLFGLPIGMFLMMLLFQKLGMVMLM